MTGKFSKGLHKVTSEETARMKRLREDDDAPPPQTNAEYQQMKRDLEVTFWRPGRRR